MNLNERLFTQAKGIIPGGVDSPVRAFGGVGGTPRFISAAKGAYVPTPTGATMWTWWAPGARPC